MPPLLVGRDVSFYGSPITKALVLFTSITTLLSSIIHPLGQNGSVWLNYLNTCTYSSVVTWIMGVVLFYWSRSLELQLGSLKFMRLMFTSYLSSMCLYLSFFFSSLSQFSFTDNHSSSFILITISILVMHFVLTVKGSVLYRFRQVCISSHLFVILLLSLMSLYILNSLPALTCGILGAITIHFLGSLPLPRRLSNWILKVIKLIVTEKQPRLLSGATIDIQRQQRMDLLEGFVMGLQQNRFEVQQRGGVRARESFVPGDDQVRQLTLMGFRWDEARQALISSQGQIHHAVQILTTNTH